MPYAYKPWNGVNPVEESYLQNGRRGTDRSRLNNLLDSHYQGKKRARLLVKGAGQIPGDDLLSQDLSSHYHRRCSVSLPGSEWDRVVPLRSGHQRATSFKHACLCFGAGLWGTELCLFVRGHGS
jgi:hypothetical protein